MGDSEWLNEDFKSSKSAVTLCLKGLGPNEDLPAGSILQIQSVTNISVPLKSQLEGRTDYDPKNHVLKIVFTDGKETVSGVLYDYHPKLNMDTIPGTKIKTLKPISFISKVLRLSRGNIEILGGYVEKLVENYKVQKDHERKQAWGKMIVNPGEEGPPKWRTLQSFGGNAGLDVGDLRSAKAMEILEESKNKGNPAQVKDTQFDVQRQEAISDLAKQKAKKNFSVAKIIPLEESSSASSTSTKTDSRPPKPRENKFQKMRDSKREEEEVAAQYEYRRGKQISLQEFFVADKSKNLNANDSTPAPTIDSVTASFESFNVRASDRDSYRGGGRGDRFGHGDSGYNNGGDREYERGRGRGQGRGDRGDTGRDGGYQSGRGRGRGRGRGERRDTGRDGGYERGRGRGRGQGDYSRNFNYNDDQRQANYNHQRPYDGVLNNEVKYVQDFPTLGNDPFQVTTAPGNYDFQLGESLVFQRGQNNYGQGDNAPYQREDRGYEPMLGGSYRGSGSGGYRGNRRSRGRY